MAQALELLSHVAASLQDRLSYLKSPPSNIGLSTPHMDVFGPLFPMGSPPYDAFFSILSLHGVEDLKKELTTIYQSLAPGGLFLSVFYGGESLKELRHALCEVDLRLRGKVSPHVFPMIDLRDYAHCLKASGFELPVTDIERFHVNFPTWRDLFYEVRLLGERNRLAARASGLYGRNYFEALEKMPSSVTLELVYGHARKPG